MIEVTFFVIVDPTDKGTHLTTARIPSAPDRGEVIWIGGFPYVIVERSWTLGHRTGQDTLAATIRVRTMFERIAEAQ